MRIGIASLGRVAEDTGGKNYIVHFVAEALRSYLEHTFVLFMSEGEANALHLEPNKRLEVVTIAGTKRSPLHKVFGEQVRLSRAAKRAGVDVLYCPGNFVPIFSRIPTVVNIRATAHFYGSQYGITGLRRFIRKLLMPASARSARAIITPSEDIKKDVVRFCHVPAQKITVIPHGVDTRLFTPECRSSPEYVEVLNKFGLADSQYLLYVSALWQYKNHTRLSEAHAEIVKTHPDLKLVIAGLGTGTDPAYIARLHALPKSLGTDHLVIFTGAQPQSVLKYLYAGASAVVFPSLYESFGNPIFEAWASGVPIATSNVHSFPEIVSDAGVLFDPTSATAIADSVRRLLEDAELRRTLVGRGLARVKKFTWEACVARTLSCIQRVSESNGSGL